MIDRSLLQTHLAQTETMLADLKQRRVILDKEIATVEDMVRIDRERLHNLDGHSSPASPQQAAPAPRPSEKIVPPSFDDVLGKQRPRYGSKKHRVLVAVAEFLADGRERHRKEITEHLMRQGIVPNNQRAFAQVSNYLSLAKEHFVSTRHGYWALKQQAKAAE